MACEVVGVDFIEEFPETLDFVQPVDAKTPLGTAFRVENIAEEDSSPLTAAVSHVHWMQLSESSDPVLVVCDMRRGGIRSLPLRDRDTPQRLLGRLSHPCHVEPCDLDGNGTTDLVVAELGSYAPADHDQGRVVLLPQNKDGSFGSPVDLATGLGWPVKKLARFTNLY